MGYPDFAWGEVGYKTFCSPPLHIQHIKIRLFNIVCNTRKLQKERMSELSRLQFTRKIPNILFQVKQELSSDCTTCLTCRAPCVCGSDTEGCARIAIFKAGLSKVWKEYVSVSTISE